jgi:hypothetical protein
MGRRRTAEDYQRMAEKNGWNYLGPGHTPTGNGQSEKILDISAKKAALIVMRRTTFDPAL